MWPSLSVVTSARAGQVECKRLVRKDANESSAAMQMGGRIYVIAQETGSPAKSQQEQYFFLLIAKSHLVKPLQPPIQLDTRLSFDHALQDLGYSVKTAGAARSE